MSSVARPLHQLFDERLRDFRGDAQPAVRQRAALVKDRFSLVQRLGVREFVTDQYAALVVLIGGHDVDVSLISAVTR